MGLSSNPVPRRCIIHFFVRLFLLCSPGVLLPVAISTFICSSSSQRSIAVPCLRLCCHDRRNSIGKKCAQFNGKDKLIVSVVYARLPLLLFALVSMPQISAFVCYTRAILPWTNLLTSICFPNTSTTTTKESYSVLCHKKSSPSFVLDAIFPLFAQYHGDNKKANINRRIVQIQRTQHMNTE